MAEQIRQEIGLDASGAISGINQLIGALANLDNALLRSQKAFQNFNKGAAITKNLGNLNKRLGTTADQMKRVATNSKQLDNATNRTKRLQTASSGLLLSWQTLGRIAIAQGIVRGLNTIQAEFSEALRLATEFGLAVAEAAAISPAGIGNFEQSVANLNRELIATSSSFGFNVLDLAEAKYQEFSNQVRGSAESNRLFIAANKLARISASEVGESVGALSSVLNSYDQSVESADQVSAALFKTIELGRLRLSDIADQLGNVTPLARSAGISFEEVAASLTAITRSGVNPSRALTQIRAIINQLTKPTAALQEVFRETFQVADITEAIQRFGSLQGVIDAIAQEAGGNASRIAELFSNVRARNAFESLSQQSELVTENLREIGNAADEGSAFIDAFLEKFEEQDAVQFTKALNNLKLSFLELAQDALPTVTKGIEAVTFVIENFGQIASTVAVGSLSVYAFRARAAAIATTELGAASVGARVGLIGMAATVGFLVTQMLILRDQQKVLADINQDLAALDQIEIDALKQIAADTTETIKGIKALGDEGDVAFKRLQEAAGKSNAAIRRANDAFVGGVSSTLDRLVAGRTDLVKRLDDIIEKSEDRRTKNAQEQTDIRNKISDTEFERQIRGRTELQKAFARAARAQAALSEARFTPTNEEGLEDRLEQLQRAERLANEAISDARASGNRTQVFRAENLLNEILREQLNTKRAQQNLDAEQVALARAKRDEEKAKLDELKKNVKILKDNLSLFDSGGSPLSPEEIDTATKRAESAFDKIREAAFDRGDLSAADILGLTQLELDFNKTLQEVKFKAPRENLEQALQEAAEGQSVQIPVNFFLEQAEGLGIDTSGFNPNNPTQGLQNISNEAETQLQTNAQLQQRLNEELTTEQKLRDGIQARLKQIIDLNEGNVAGFQRLDNLIGSQSAVTLVNNLERVKATIDEIASKSFITDEDIQRVDQLLRSFNQGVGDLPGTGVIGFGGVGGEGTFIQNFTDGLRDLQAQQKETVGSQGELNRAISEQQGLASLILGISDAFQNQASAAGQTATKVTEGANAQAGMAAAADVNVNAANSLKTAYDGVARSINSAAAAQRSLNSAQAGSSAPAPITQRFGGPVFRAMGGFAPRGTDTIPAMLSPGEFVMNASASRKFASQLIAMNAGTTPVFRQEGGPVINNSVNVGDINVNGTSDPNAVARRVMSEIRREFRRGTSSRFR